MLKGQLSKLASKTIEKVVLKICYKIALAGNRTRASRVAGENSTTEPPMLVKGYVL